MPAVLLRDRHETVSPSQTSTTPESATLKETTWSRGAKGTMASKQGSHCPRTDPELWPAGEILPTQDEISLKIQKTLKRHNKNKTAAKT